MSVVRLLDDLKVEYFESASFSASSMAYFLRLEQAPCPAGVLKLIVSSLWVFSSLSHSGPASSEAMPNVNGVVGGFEAQLNGPASPPAPPQSASSPVSSQQQQPSPGVAPYPPSEGASAELTVHTGDSLQSLRLSIPMQETELCKHKLMWSEYFPPPLLSPCIYSFCTF